MGSDVPALYSVLIASFVAGLLVLVWSRSSFAIAPRPQLHPVSFESVSDPETFDQEVWKKKEAIIGGIDDNLQYLKSQDASNAYEPFDRHGVSRTLVEQSLKRFRQLLVTSQSAEELRTRLMQEFMLYRPRGNDGRGTVRFTGYFQPTYRASRNRSDEYRFPIYELPADFETWAKPHPTRVALEGYTGEGDAESPLSGHELAWLKTRFEAFMIHVQGSAILELPDGSQMAVGFAGATDHPFRGISKSFLKEHGISWTALPEYFTQHPDELHACLASNNRYIFFKENDTPLPIGSLGVPVIPERSMATDKRILPPGALGLISTAIPFASPNGGFRLQRTSRFVLDQDTGSGIKGPGRVDLFMGTGPEAQQRANYVYADGELYYLLLK